MVAKNYQKLHKDLGFCTHTIVHGLASSYSNHRCRCDPCRMAQALMTRKYMDSYRMRLRMMGLTSHGKLRKRPYNPRPAMRRPYAPRFAARAENRKLGWFGQGMRTLAIAEYLESTRARLEQAAQSSADKST